MYPRLKRLGLSLANILTGPLTDSHPKAVVCHLRHCPASRPCRTLGRMKNLAGQAVGMTTDYDHRTYHPACLLGVPALPDERIGMGHTPSPTEAVSSRSLRAHRQCVPTSATPKLSTTYSAFSIAQRAPVVPLVLWAKAAKAGAFPPGLKRLGFQP